MSAKSSVDVSWRQRLSRYRWNRNNRNEYLRIRSTTISSRTRIAHSNSVNSNTLSAINRIINEKISSYVILSVVEGRGSSAGVIGIASIDLHLPHIELSEFRDTSSYSRMLVKLLAMNPNEIIVPHSTLGQMSCMQNLIRVLRNVGKRFSIIGVHRSRFNDKQGLADLRRLCNRDYLSSIYANKGRFYALAAAASVFHYVRQSHGVIQAPGSLKFTFTGSIQTTMIDFETANRLELVENMRDHSTKDSLYASIDCTCTPGGARLLRANLLEPPMDPPTILKRQEAVNELVNSPEKLVSIQSVLRQLPYIDGLLSWCVQISKSPDSSCKSSVELRTDLPTDAIHHQIYTTNPTNAKIFDQKTSGNSIHGSPMNPPRLNPGSSSFLLDSCGLENRRMNLQAAESRITRVIAIKNLLDLVPSLYRALGTVTSDILAMYKELLSDPGYENILKQICTVVHTDVKICKGTLAMTSQKCFAIKEGISVMLDVTRNAYSEQLDDVTVEVRRLAQKLELPLRIAHNKIRGFYIQFAESALVSMQKRRDSRGFQKYEYKGQWSDSQSSITGFEPNPSTQEDEVSYSERSKIRSKHPSLPEELIKVTYQKGLVNCTTESLMRLNERMKGSLQEVYYIADKIICDLISELHPEMGLFYRLSEVVAGCDLLASLARLVLSAPAGLPFTYPRLSDRFAVKNGRNIALERRLTYPTVPNHVYTSPDLSLIIVGGPNMAGKTIYLKQVAYIQILAQIGSAVPAEFATIRIADQIFYHCGGSDDLVSKESSFTKEMKGMSYILRQATENSLILIDGLCLGTNPDEAVILVQAICEDLLERKICTFVTTQCQEILCLPDCYPNSESCFFAMNKETFLTDGPAGQEHLTDSTSLASAINPQNSSESFQQSNPNGKMEQQRVSFPYKLFKGKPTGSHHGLELAQMTNIPGAVIARAKEILRELEIFKNESSSRLPFCSEQQPGENTPISQNSEQKRKEFQLLRQLLILAKSRPKLHPQNQREVLSYIAYLKEKYKNMITPKMSEE